MLTENNKPKMIMKCKARMVTVRDNEEFEMPFNATDIKTVIDEEEALMIVSWLERA